VFVLITAALTHAVALAGEAPPSAESAPTPRFTIEVRSVLSKAGCNAGTCHGNQNGKGGFRLSLWGEDANFDHHQILRSYGGRRVDLLKPEQSLLLLKPLLEVPHGGGRRIEHGSAAHNILKRWLAAGAPRDRRAPRLVDLKVAPAESILTQPVDRVQLRVTARFSNGEQRDVTDFAIYESTTMAAEANAAGLVQRREFGETNVLVRYLDHMVAVPLAFLPRRDEFTWQAPPAANYIDHWVHAKLERMRVQPSPPAADHVFLRRAYLDTLGVPPTAEEARAFAADTRVDRRERLIDRLLARPEFADRWALIWADLLRNEEKVLDSRGVTVFHQWIRDSIARGKPLNEFVAELVSARGSTYKNPPANYYRALRDPFTRGEAAARVFLGVRMQCAKCHNHPFERWTQDDYYSWAAVFGVVDYKILSNKRRDKFDKNEFNGEQIVLLKPVATVKHAGTGRVATPRPLGAEEPMTVGKSAGADQLKQLADWLAGGENRQFARAQVNRIWHHLMGRGLVEPIDDFRDTNPPSNPELLEALTDDFIRHNYDLRRLVRRIMTSRTYQRSWRPNETNADDEANFARSLVRRLTAEQLLDAQCQVLAAPARFNGYPLGIRAGQIPGVERVRARDKEPAEGDRFLRAFGKPQRLLSCECERSNETTLKHALVLLSGQGLHDRLRYEDGRIARLAISQRKTDEIIDELFWTALSRPPTDQEIARARTLIESAADRRAGLEDLAWGLLNSKEFLLRR